MTELEIRNMDWDEFNTNFIVRVKDSTNLWIVPITDQREVELRLERNNKCFSFCVLSKEEIEKVIEKLQKALKEIET